MLTLIYIFLLSLGLAADMPEHPDAIFVGMHEGLGGQTSAWPIGACTLGRDMILDNVPDGYIKKTIRNETSYDWTMRAVIHRTDGKQDKGQEDFIVPLAPYGDAGASQPVKGLQRAKSGMRIERFIIPKGDSCTLLVRQSGPYPGSTDITIDAYGFSQTGTDGVLLPVGGTCYVQTHGRWTTQSCPYVISTTDYLAPAKYVKIVTHLTGETTITDNDLRDVSKEPRGF